MMGGGVGMAEMIWAVLGLLLLGLAWRTVEQLWWKPKRLERALKQQGLRGTRYSLFLRDLREFAALEKEANSRPMPLFSHDVGRRVAPFFHNSMKEHGMNSYTWYGTTPRVTLMDPKLIGEVLSNKFGQFESPDLSPIARMLITGLLGHDGEKWAKHRRIINPAFHVEKLKRMLPAFYTCCAELVSRWEKNMGPEGCMEVDVWPQFQNLTGDVISHAAFGSSYQEGTRIFQLQEELTELVMQFFVKLYIPGYRYLPTSDNNRRNAIMRETREILKGIIEKREHAIKMGEPRKDDLLGLLIESNLKERQEQGSSAGMTTEDIIQECKLFYLAGQETTALLLTWTMILLSMYPSWQARAREEVLQAFGESVPDAEGVNRLKIVTMILYEVLRLYPPGLYLTRRPKETTELGGINYPGGVQLILPLVFVHHDPDFWGEDVNEFNPERFAQGVANACKVQGAFFPFGWGPRVCIGQNFAMMEAKLALSMMLRSFSFELSPSYVHAPCIAVSLHPQHGAPIKLRKL